MTETGRGILWGTILVLLACFMIPAFGILAALIALQGVALGLGWWFRPRLHMYGSWPAEASAGESITATFTVENLSRYPAYQLVIAPRSWPAGISPQTSDSILFNLGARERRTVTLSAHCQQRGLYALAGPVCASSFPFNLYRFSTRPSPPQPVLVLPAYRPLVLDLYMNGHQGGRWNGQSRHLTGLSPEYIGSRPFLPGDSPRHVDSRAWARLGRPAVKEYFEESSYAVGLVLETWPSASASQHRHSFARDFETAVSLATAVVHALPPTTTIACLVTGSTYHALPLNNLPLQIAQVHRLLATVQVEREPAQSEYPVHLLKQLPSIDALFLVSVQGLQRTQHLADLARRCACETVCYQVESEGAKRPTVHPTIQGIQTHRIARSAIGTWEAGS
jgi:uncharacterized protein (DUF58 family)